MKGRSLSSNRIVFLFLLSLCFIQINLTELKEEIVFSKDTEKNNAEIDQDSQSPVKIVYNSMNASNFILSHEINEINNPMSSTRNVSIQLNKFLLENQSYKVIPYNSENLNQTGLSFGLGIRLNNTNDILQSLKKAHHIDKQILFYTKSPKEGILFLNDRHLNETDYFEHNCALTERKDLDKKYHNSWVCDFHHVLLGQKAEWNKTIEINGRAVFDTQSDYIIAPVQYYDLIMEHYRLYNRCEFFSNEDEIVELHCDITREDITSFEPIAFVFDGIGYMIPPEKLFLETKEDDNKTCFVSTIIFRKEDKNIWTFGAPLLSTYELGLDYDRRILALYGGNVMNLTMEWNDWKKNNEKIHNKNKMDKYMMYIGIILGSLILITIFAMIIRAFRKGCNPPNHSNLIEEVPQ